MAPKWRSARNTTKAFQTVTCCPPYMESSEPEYDSASLRDISPSACLPFVLSHQYEITPPNF